MSNAASDSRPWQLRALVAVLVGQAAVMLSYVVLDIAVASRKPTPNWGAVAFLVTLLGLWGLGLVWCSRGLWRGRRWGFTPAVFTQLMFGLIAVTVIPSAVPVARVIWLVILVSAIAGLWLAFSAPMRSIVAR